VAVFFVVFHRPDSFDRVDAFKDRLAADFAVKPFHSRNLSRYSTNILLSIFVGTWLFHALGKDMSTLDCNQSQARLFDVRRNVVRRLPIFSAFIQLSRKGARPSKKSRQTRSKNQWCLCNVVTIVQNAES
jgi:hypothetical protein